ncbi:MAG TPA: response regulator [Bacteroidota bacterium]|nr:response regulator [Bacteroidota bacterium]
MDTQRKSILIVDDEAIIALSEASSLKREGYEVVHATTGELAIEIVRTRREGIDLILMDIELGKGMDGTQAAQEILKTHDIPILFLSSHTEKEIVEKTEKITSYGYVVKNSGDVVLFASIKMAFKLHQAQRDLRAAEEKYSKAFQASPDAININRLEDGVYIAVNEGFCKLTGYTVSDVVGRSSLPGDLGIWVHEEDRQKLVSGLKKTGEVTGLEAQFRYKNGAERTGMMSARVLEINGEKCILSITHDISERKRAEDGLQQAIKQKEILLRELQHRVKNNLTIISSLIGLELPRLLDEKARQVFVDARSRISAMSRIYEQLDLLNDVGVVDLHRYVIDLAQSLFVTYNVDKEKVRLSIRIEEVEMKTERAVYLGLVVNELMTNALKYAFPKGGEGEIRVELRRNGEMLTLSVADDGVGLPDGLSADASKGVGLGLVKMLSQQIGGDMIVAGTKGTAVSINCPA